MLQSVLQDDPKGHYREFVLSPHFRTSFQRAQLSSSFNLHVPEREVVELAFISEVYSITPIDLENALRFSARKLGFNPNQSLPSARDIEKFKIKPEWMKFVQTSSINTYKNAVRYDPNEIFPEKSIPENLTITTPSKLISDLLIVNNGVALGDHHGDVCITTFLQEEIPALKRQGVQTLYFEMIESVHQKSLDNYLETGDLDILETIIRDAWDRKGEGGMRQKYTGILEEARVHNIRVIAIDKAEAGNRFHDSNPHWTDVIKEDRKNHQDNEKFIVFGGHYHFCDNPQNGRIPVTSVSKHLGIPSIEFHAGSVEGQGIQTGIHKNHNDFVVILPDCNNTPTLDAKNRTQKITIQPSPQCTM